MAVRVVRSSRRPAVRTAAGVRPLQCGSRRVRSICRWKRTGMAVRSVAPYGTRWWCRCVPGTCAATGQDCAAIPTLWHRAEIPGIPPFARPRDPHARNSLPRADREIRIGLVVAELHVEPWVEFLDHVYSNVSDSSSVATTVHSRLRAVSTMVCVRGCSRYSGWK